MVSKLKKMYAIILLLVFLSLLLLTSLISCSEDEEPFNDYTPPILSVTPVDMSTVNWVIVFGEGATPSTLSPCFNYGVNASSVEVRAGSDGYIDTVFLNDNIADYEIWIKTSSNNVYFLEYDHILNVAISEGDKVVAGTVIGTVGEGNFTEFMVWEYGDIAHCPFQFATDDFIQQHESVTANWCLEDSISTVP